MFENPILKIYNAAIIKQAFLEKVNPNWLNCDSRLLFGFQEGFFVLLWSLLWKYLITKKNIQWTVV